MKRTNLDPNSHEIHDNCVSQVRWADLEAKKEEERRRKAVGFCIGGSWRQVSEEEAQAILAGTVSHSEDS